MSLLNNIKKVFLRGAGVVKTVTVGALDEHATKTRENFREVVSASHFSLEDIDVNPEFQRAAALVDAGCPLIFVTGKAGTGKSTFIQYLRANTSKNVAVVAPTGVAALNAYGQTIHSFFHFPPRPIDLGSIRRVKNRTLYERLHTLIIDEASMVRADLMDGIDRFLRLNAGNPAVPFGGVQVVLVGDLFQLPPVVSRREEARLFSGRYASEYFFSAHCLRSCELACVELTKVYRQDDRDFIQLIDSIREDNDSKGAIAEINRVCFKEAAAPETQLTLTCTNAAAGRINSSRLRKLKSKEYVFEARVVGKFSIEEEKVPAPYELRLKVGTQVMFTKNDSQKRWVNGTIGVVKRIPKDAIQVQVASGTGDMTYETQRATWESLAFYYNEQEQKVVTKVIGTYHQFPLMLAWAVTIHKGQGKTLENVLVDLGSGAFAHGQVYVALSRCRSLKDITLKSPIVSSDVICDIRVKRFYAALRELRYDGDPDVK